MILTDLVLPIRYTESDLISLIGKHMRREPVRSFRILKRSIDARKKPDLKFVITVAVNEALPEPEPDPISEPLLPIDPVCVVGSGPAGLFAAFTLLKHRIPVILLERGKPVEERVKD
ncbi:MAG: FAD-dependent oxidoreductase, partial [Lachnospiraceae bacterium]|nr:FAD-dependent oxidoreductase [Lachnospiraceae bacterium]